MLEVIIALGVLGLGLASFLQVMPIAIRSSVRAEYNSRAPLLAQQIMDTYKADYTGEGLRFNAVMPVVPLRDPVPIDNDGDGLFDEEIPNGIDDDGDGEIDEDLPEYEMFPFYPMSFKKPNDDMAWQILCSRISVNGRILPEVMRIVVRIAWYPTEDIQEQGDPPDGIDNDLDGVVDESIPYDYKYDLEGIIFYEEETEEE